MTDEQIQKRRDEFIQETANLGPMKVRLPRELRKNGSYTGPPGLELETHSHNRNTSPHVFGSMVGPMLTRDQALEVAAFWSGMTRLDQNKYDGVEFANLTAAVEWFYDFLERKLDDVALVLLQRASELTSLAKELREQSKGPF